MKIGEVKLENPYILAPMAGVTDLPFRLLCKEQGAGLLCMEKDFIGDSSGRISGFIATVRIGAGYHQ